MNRTLKQDQHSRGQALAGRVHSKLGIDWIKKNICCPKEGLTAVVRGRASGLKDHKTTFL